MLESETVRETCGTYKRYRGKGKTNDGGEANHPGILEVRTKRYQEVWNCREGTSRSVWGEEKGRKFDGEAETEVEEIP